jgi:hypothetical protein
MFCLLWGASIGLKLKTLKIRNLFLALGFFVLFLNSATDSQPV